MMIRILMVMVRKAMLRKLDDVDQNILGDGQKIDDDDMRLDGDDQKVDET